MSDGFYKYAYKSKNLCAWIDEHLKLLYSEWLLCVSSEECKTGFGILANIARSQNISIWIAEFSKISKTMATDQLWTPEILLPLFENSCLNKIACVDTSYPVACMYDNLVIENIFELSEGLKEFKQFYTYKEAADWVGDIKA